MNTNLLDTNRNNSNKTNSPRRSQTYCGLYVLIGDTDEFGPDTEVRRVFCKTYACPTCGEIRKAKVWSAIKKLIAENKLLVMATLTLNPKACSAENSVKYIAALWNKHRIYQRRDLGKRPEYIRVVEFQKNGYAHLHLALSDFVDHAWLSRTWQALGGGFVWLNKFNNSDPASYLAKYLAKGVDEEVYGRFRRVSTSRGLRLNGKPLSPEQKRGNFEFKNIQYESLKEVVHLDIHKEIRWHKKLQIERGFVTSRAIVLHGDTSGVVSG